MRRILHRDVNAAKNIVANSWNVVHSVISSIAVRSEIRPKSPNDIFECKPSANEKEIIIEVKPIVFEVPERTPNPQRNFIFVSKDD